jgi:hypothetical protein
MSANDRFAAVNGVSIMLGEARSLAVRLALRHDPEGAVATLDTLAERGGEATLEGADAAAATAALDEWLAETNEDVLGPRLLELRDRLRRQTT